MPWYPPDDPFWRLSIPERVIVWALAAFCIYWMVSTAWRSIKPSKRLDSN